MNQAKVDDMKGEYKRLRFLYAAIFILPIKYIFILYLARLLNLGDPNFVLFSGLKTPTEFTLTAVTALTVLLAPLFDKQSRQDDTMAQYTKKLITSMALNLVVLNIILALTCLNLFFDMPAILTINGGPLIASTIITAIAQLRLFPGQKKMEMLPVREGENLNDDNV